MNKNLEGTEYEGMILPMLAKDFSVDRLRKHFLSQRCLLQPKLDGVRMLYTGSSTHACGKFHSRKGKPIATILSNLKEEIEDIFKDTPTDGEIYRHSSDEDKFEFHQIISQVRSQNADLFTEDERIEYHVYDLPIPDVPFEERYDRLKDIANQNKSSRIKIVPCSNCSVEDILNEFDVSQIKDRVEKKELKAKYDVLAQDRLNIYETHGYEGTMARNPDSQYCFGDLSPSGKNKGHPSSSKGRTDNLLKIKKFIDIEARVVSVLPGEKGNRNEDRLGSVVCEFSSSLPKFKGKTITCKCGSGFSDETRDLYWKNPSLIVGKDITLKFQEYSKDGVPRFPVFVAIRDYE